MHDHTNKAARPRIRPGEWDASTFLGIGDTNRPSNFSQTIRPSDCQQKKKKKEKKRNCRILDSAVPANYRVKLKESEKRDRYLDLAGELKKQWNMKVMVISIVIGVLSTVTKGLVQELEDLEIRLQTETIQTTALLRPTRILRRVLATWGDLLSLKLLWKTIS